ncbi:MAG: hypothetical protein HY314_03790 [Acidobacteria bacterium]|nr:hypothetical protein [Acidobacteriota bacterium]
MKDAAEYVTTLKALIAANPQVVQLTIMREETLGDLGMIRYRLTLRSGDLLEMVERFQVVMGKVETTKYSFHWQDVAGGLGKRWDSAAHHPEVSTHPHHVHDGTEGNVFPHEPMSAEKVLALIAAQVKE